MDWTEKVSGVLGDVGGIIDQGVEAWDKIVGRGGDYFPVMSNPPAPAAETTSPDPDLTEKAPDLKALAVVGAVVLVAVLLLR